MEMDLLNSPAGELTIGYDKGSVLLFYRILWLIYMGWHGVLHGDGAGRMGDMSVNSLWR